MNLNKQDAPTADQLRQHAQRRVEDFGAYFQTLPKIVAPIRANDVATVLSPRQCSTGTR